MSYKQLFLLILTIWSAELVTRLVFDMMLPPQMEYRTVYLKKDSNQQLFLGSAIGDLGRRGWKIAYAVQDPDSKERLVVFMQRQTILQLGD